MTTDDQNAADELLGMSAQLRPGEPVPWQPPVGRQQDGGKLDFQIGTTNNGNVVMQFQRPVFQLGMTPAEALVIAEALVKHAGEAKKEALVMKVQRLND